MKKQTSVEWLVEQFEQSHSYINEIFKETIDQAKAMEREQIIDAYLQGSFNWQRQGATQFYNETYNGGKQ